MISKFVIYCNTIFSNNIKKASILKYSILCFMVGLNSPSKSLSSIMINKLFSRCIVLCSYLHD